MLFHIIFMKFSYLLVCKLNFLHLFFLLVYLLYQIRVVRLRYFRRKIFCLSRSWSWEWHLIWVFFLQIIIQLLLVVPYLRWRQYDLLLKWRFLNLWWRRFTRIKYSFVASRLIIASYSCTTSNNLRNMLETKHLTLVRREVILFEACWRKRTSQIVLEMVSAGELRRSVQSWDDGWGAIPCCLHIVSPMLVDLRIGADRGKKMLLMRNFNL